MTSITESIANELLDVTNDPTAIEDVLTRHRKSKGPLYIALAQATTQVRDDLRTLAEQKAASEAIVNELRKNIADLEEKVRPLDSKGREAESRLAEVQELLGRAEVLSARGFNEKNLDRLFELLGQIAAEHGAPPEEGIDAFFETVGRFERILSLDLEAKRAEARVSTSRAQAERWEAEARRKEVGSRARIESVEALEKLLDQGVKEDDLPRWHDLLGRAGITVRQLASALDKLGSTGAVIKDQGRRAGALKAEIPKLESRVEALTEQRENLEGAVLAVKEQAVHNIEQAGREAAAEVDGVANRAVGYLDDLVKAAVNYGELKSEAESLGEHVRMARSLILGQRDGWPGISVEVVQGMLGGIIQWVRREADDGPAPVPEMVRRAGVLSYRNRLKLSDILVWAVWGLLSEQERRGLSVKA